MYLVRKNIVTTKNENVIVKGMSVLYDAGVWENIKCFNTKEELNDYMKNRYTEITNMYDRYEEYMYTKVTEYVVYETYDGVEDDGKEHLPKIIRVSELNPKYRIDKLIKSIKEEDYDDLRSKNGYYNDGDLLWFLEEEYNIFKMAKQKNTYYFKTDILQENGNYFVLHIDVEQTKDGIKVIDVY